MDSNLVEEHLNEFNSNIIDDELWVVDSGRRPQGGIGHKYITESPQLGRLS